MNHRPRRGESGVNDHKLTPIEEQTLITYIIEQDTQGFPMRLSGVKDMADLLLALRDGWQALGTTLRGCTTKLENQVQSAM